MPDLTAKRTLVKSPPELWEELSEVDRLAKHLGAFGEITITKLEPEHTVAWEGERASGTVSIEPSGWGTKVTLRAELPAGEEPEPKPPDHEPAATDASTEAQEAPEAPAEPPVEEAQHVDDQIRRLRVEPAAEAEAEPEPEPLPEATTEPLAEAEAPEPEPRRGFFGWLFRRRTEPIAQAPKPVATEPEPLAAEPEPVSEPVAVEPTSEPLAAEPVPDPLAAEPVPDPVAAEPVSEPVAAEPVSEPVADEPESELDADALDAAAALDPERVLVILDEALDALGAAHHRPFSRG
jgi:hypothetical protein